MAALNTVVHYLGARQWVLDDEIVWEPYYFPWEIKKHARREELTREQVIAQFQPFRRTRAKERLQTEAKRKEKRAKATAKDTVLDSSTRG